MTGLHRQCCDCGPCPTGWDICSEPQLLDLTGLVFTEQRIACDSPECSNGVTFAAGAVVLDRTITFDLEALEWQLAWGDISGTGSPEYYWEPTAVGHVRFSIEDLVDAIEYDSDIPGDSTCESTASSLGGSALLDVDLDALGPDDVIDVLEGSIRAVVEDGDCVFRLELTLQMRRFDGFEYNRLADAGGSTIGEVGLSANLGFSLSIVATGTYAADRCPDEVSWTLVSMTLEDYDDMVAGDFSVTVPAADVVGECGPGTTCDGEDPCFHLFGTTPYVDESAIGEDQFSHRVELTQTDPGLTVYA